VTVELGRLTFVPASERPELVAEPVRPHLQGGLWVSEIDPDLADTTAFCGHYDVGLDISANCVVVEARRAERTWHAACLVLALLIDVNVTDQQHVIIGSGIRGSKLLAATDVLASLPNAEVLALTKAA
jgi:hypothetical protein